VKLEAYKEQVERDYGSSSRLQENKRSENNTECRNRYQQKQAHYNLALT
jgi:hypothetical protein